jgi:hypothetical protein
MSDYRNDGSYPERDPNYRNPDFDRTRAADEASNGTMFAVIAVAAMLVLGLFFMYNYSGSNTTASNQSGTTTSSPATTTGSGAVNRPANPASTAPTSTAPAAPSAPSSTPAPATPAPQR